jgi:hypothetical protein
MEEEDISENILNKYNEIIEYYNFHKEIESYFSEGFNKKGNGIIQNFYFIDLDWIKKWKRFINYELTVLNLQKGLKYLIDNNILNNNEENMPSNIHSGESQDNFINKMLYKIEDFDCIVNENTYQLFDQNYGHIWNIFFSKIESIKGVLYDNMLILLIKKNKRIKILYKGEMEGKIQLIQLSLDFPDKEGGDPFVYRHLSQGV